MSNIVSASPPIKGIVPKSTSPKKLSTNPLFLIIPANTGVNKNTTSKNPTKNPILKSINQIPFLNPPSTPEPSKPRIITCKIIGSKPPMLAIMFNVSLKFTSLDYRRFLNHHIKLLHLNLLRFLLIDYIWQHDQF